MPRDLAWRWREAGVSHLAAATRRALFARAPALARETDRETDRETEGEVGREGGREGERT